MQHAQEFLPGQEFGSNLPGDLGELGELSCSPSEDLRIELDQSELKQQELQEKVHQLTSEAADLKAVLSDLQEQLLAKGPNQEKEGEQSSGEALHTTTQELESLQTSERKLEAKLSIAENRNMELLSKLDGALSEKGQQAANYCDSAWKIQELLTKLKEAEEERIESKRESEDRARLAERLAQDLTLQKESVKEMEGKLDTCRVSADKERTTAKQQADELQVTITHLQGALSLKERETGNLQTQLQDVQRALEAQEVELEEHKKRMQDELQHKNVLEDKLNTKMNELSTSTQKIRQLENQNQQLTAESQSFQGQAKKLEEYKTQCTSLMEINAKLIQTVKRNEDSSKELAQTKTALERELITAQAFERQLISRLESAGLTVENQNLEKCILNGQTNNEETEIEQLGEKSISRLERLDDSAAVPQEELLEAIESSRTENGESTSRLALAEAQLELNMKEVSRLQEEVMELRAQLLVSSEQRMKIQALQEVTEASREDLRAQTEQLKSQVEELNRRHVDELLRCHEREDALVKERDMEAKARSEIQTNITAMREELHLLKKQNSTLVLENEEAREALHRANTETAELGVHVCMLKGQNEEAQLRWEEFSAKLQEVQMEAQEEVETLSDSMEAMSNDNARLQEQLKQTEGLPEAMQKLQERLEQVEEEAKSLKDIRQREVDTLRSQLSDEAAHHQSQIQVTEVNNAYGFWICHIEQLFIIVFLKGLNEELDALRKRLENEVEKVSSLESKVLELEVL